VIIITKEEGLRNCHLSLNAVLNRLGGFIISAALVYVSKMPRSGAIIYEFSYPSVSNMLSTKPLIGPDKTN